MLPLASPALRRLVTLALVAALNAALSITLLATPAAAWRPLVLTITPGQATPGTEVDIFGEGFRGRSGGFLTWGGRSLVEFTTDVHGRFRLTADVPQAPLGSVLVEATSAGRTARADFRTLAPEPAPTPTTAVADSSPLTWAPPATDGYTPLVIADPGTYNLKSDVDYLLTAPERIDGPVHVRGGRNVVWIGGHIHIPDLGSAPVSSAARRGLVISDIDETRGSPATYGYSKEGRVVHIEGLLIDGPDLTEGINTNAPSAVVQIQNVRVEGVHFKNSDDRDGVAGWSKNHPDVLQTWGSQRELRVDGLSGSSAYQGIFLKEDAADSVRGPVWLRRVDVRAVERVGTDGIEYAGHRMLSWYGNRVGRIHLDEGTVRVTHHLNSGWNRAMPNPDPSTAFWRGRYWSPTQNRYLLEPPPGGAVFTDALGDTTPSETGVDDHGAYAQWDGGQVVDWAGTGPGKIYSGAAGDGEYVPAGSAGVGYVSPGYAG